jgi:hypothetical protein
MKPRWLSAGKDPGMRRDDALYLATILCAGFPSPSQGEGWFCVALAKQKRGEVKTLTQSLFIYIITLMRNIRYSNVTDIFVKTAKCDENTYQKINNNFISHRSCLKQYVERWSV